MAAAGANVWVIRCDDGSWAVRRADEPSMLRRVRTQADALAVGQRLARSEGVDLIVMGHGGITRLSAGQPGGRPGNNGRS